MIFKNLKMELERKTKIMIIKNLGNVRFETIINCFLKSFENYFVELPTDADFWKKRWVTAKVDYNLSYGMFDGNKLAAFIINAVDERNGTKIAFNTGTGVLPKYRGNRIVKSIYDYAIPDLKINGVTKCALEVITDNIKAIKSYQSIGFEICKTFECYKGNINLKSCENVTLNKTNYNAFDWDNLPNQDLYSWDFHSRIIKDANYDYYQVIKDNLVESYFVINHKNGNLAQFEVLKESKGNWNRLFNGIKMISETIKINNIDTRLIEKIKFINSIGLVNTVNQYEMEMKI